MKFPTLNDALRFYTEYASIGGFEVRPATTTKDRYGVVTLKYLLCNKEGSPFKKTKNLCPNHRNRNTTRCKCKARCCVKRIIGNQYLVYFFEERHTHKFALPSGKQFMRANRRLSFDTQNFIVDCSNVGIGPSKAFDVLKQISGGYSNVGATKVDFKNIARDKKAYIGDCDAQMIIDHFTKKKTEQGFFFEYFTDKDGALSRLFWSDATSQAYGSAFGDVISFDATYRTNKYSMVFIPFTGIDNHRKCVTIAAGLLSTEDAESYKWLLDCFKRAIQCNPIIFVTDQDLSMKAAIDYAFPNTTHRYCMWHITEKLKHKVGVSLCQNTDFMKDISSAIWTVHMEHKEFEDSWNSVIEKYQLHGHSWLQLIYNMRQLWIPVYFRDVTLGSLVRTTSRSESENSFFGRFLHRHMTLVEFYMGFSSAMESQRHNTAKLDHDNRSSSPLFRCDLQIERHAAEYFTHSVFYDIQKEMLAGGFKCAIEMKTIKNEYQIFIIKDTECKAIKFEVSYQPELNYLECNCKKMQLFGIPCRHIFQVLGYLEISKFPDCLIMKRWLKEANKLPTSVFQTNSLISTTSFAITTLWNELRDAINATNNDVDKLSDLLAGVRLLKQRCVDPQSSVSNTSKNDYFSVALGVPRPAELNIKTPKHSRNKCCGQRLKSSREIGIKNSKKVKRTYKTCGKKDSHDSRNCPDKSKCNDTY